MSNFKLLILYVVVVKRYLFVFIAVISSFFSAHGQDIALYQQFNGRYDFTFIGNTMNTAENNSIFEPVTLTSSSATLTLDSKNTIEKAYLYWAGSGDGDFEVILNSESLTPDRTFGLSKTFDNVAYSYFSAFKDITTIVQNTGNGTYTLSDLDISTYESLHLLRRTNFAGWGIVIIYKNDELPLNSINIYDGLQGVPNELTITLENLNVIDNEDAKIGFLAWEGDALLATEAFTFNGNILSNTLNPPQNVFNGTNSVTGSMDLYNMDLDIYSIQNNISIGDSSAKIALSSYQDFVMINTVITKLNSQLPDATITIDSVEKECNSKIIVVNYTVSNLNCTDPLPAGTPITFYANNQLLQTTFTNIEIPIDGSVSSQITLVLPEDIQDVFELKFVADDKGDGFGIVAELNEANNEFSIEETLWLSPKYNPLENLISCNEGFTKGTFNFSNYEELVKMKPEDSVHFYETSDDANNEVSQILNTSNYITNTTPREIFIRLNNENCYSITSFLLTTRNCPPTVYNFVSANNDTKNDTFHIEGLRDIFLNYKLEIYSRWGRLLWTGNQNTEDWNGYVEEGIGTKNAPDGTYFYLLHLNDSDYPEPLTGYLYLNH